MSGLQEILQGNVRDSLPLLTLVKCAGVLSSTLLLSEVLSTLEDEVALIWPSRWSLMKVIFLVNRYSPFIDTTLGLTVMLGTTDPKSCRAQFKALTCSYAVGSFFSELILVARTLALYNFARWVLVIMVAISLGVLIPGTVVCWTLLTRIEYPERMVLQITGCVPSVDDRSSWVLYMCILISETVVVSLTVRKMWQMFAGGTAHRSLLVWTMYRDGSLYYVLLLIVSIGNLCFMLLAPKAATSIMQMPLRVLHSTLCTRVLLNLRRVAARLSDMSLDEFNRRSHIAFEHTGADHHSVVNVELGTLDSESEDDYP
ncbi:hypothetical protein PYCCODRAFT_359075 [Trametes coccinea BRFM310]|uniref:DUF6533 domain-containing protein n=1 Tax=Trametes coccinea (strain BRFM310) TaxID=1353009 RepID=A0A1Y2J4Y0_TRAC3|nr:hypothetical protein PYCCODRAFT_359075 [Trametes coccinea BRFM310]